MDFPLLGGCIALLEPATPGRGLCFHRSVALLLDAGEGTLCIGVLRGAETPEEKADPTNSPVPFVHCWMEIGDDLYAPTTFEAAGNRLYKFHRMVYYHANGVQDIRRIPLERIKALADEYGWHRYFTTGRPKKGAPSLGTIVLDECGIPYSISDRGGIIPAQEQEQL